MARLGIHMKLCDKVGIRHTQAETTWFVVGSLNRNLLLLKKVRWDVRCTNVATIRTVAGPIHADFTRDNATTFSVGSP